MEFEATLAYAQLQDNTDELREFKKQFYFPQIEDKDCIYFRGNSLGLQPKTVFEAVQQELNDWKNLAVAGFLKAKNPWMSYQDYFKKPLAGIVGCMEDEVTVMNSLTVNLHLLMFSFYRPDSSRFKIIIEAGAFPSDQYAVETQVRLHGLQVEDAIIEISRREGERTIRHEDVISAIERNSGSLALVLLSGLNYYTGQIFDIAGITEAAHKAGALAGFDLAHATGNVSLALHDWNVDFAAWCSYKYLNGGPGAVGGVFVHERYATDPSTFRIGGWWGNDDSKLLELQRFVPKANADGWNISTAQILSMAPLKASLAIFDKAGFASIIQKSRKLTAYLAFLLRKVNHLQFEMVSPDNEYERGAQLSLYFNEKGKELQQKLIASGIVVDYRDPGLIRVAPAPLYCSYEDVYRFYEIIQGFK